MVQIFHNARLHNLNFSSSGGLRGSIRPASASSRRRLLFLRFLRQLEAFSFRNVSPAIREEDLESSGGGVQSLFGTKPEVPVLRAGGAGSLMNMDFQSRFIFGHVMSDDH